MTRSTFIKKVWGKEEIICNGDYAGKILHLDKGAQCSFHAHKIKHETFFCLSGAVRMQLGDTEHMMMPGDVQVIEPCVYHSFTGLQDSKIVEVSTADYPDDSYRRTESRRGVL